jgi:tagatose-1,6-bisphosphate aldolase non-catalytic subunit AgaZ/GatZ
MASIDAFQKLVHAQKNGVAAGICSICSSHPWVLRAAMAEGKQQGNAVLIESTVNQVNQDGGYSGMVPADFRNLGHKPDE